MYHTCRYIHRTLQYILVYCLLSVVVIAVSLFRPSTLTRELKLLGLKLHTKQVISLLSFINKWPHMKLIELFLYLLLTYSKSAMPVSAMTRTTTPIAIPATVADP